MNFSETTRDSAIVTIERQWEVACALSNGDMSNDLYGPLTRISRSQHFCSGIPRKRCVLTAKLLQNTNRKQMAGRFVSVPMTLSDLERPDVMNEIVFQADLNAG